MATPLLEFIKDVDEGGVAEEKAKKAVALFSDLGISNLLELEGVPEDAIKDGDIPIIALAKRALRKVDAVQAAKRLKTATDEAKKATGTGSVGSLSALLPPTTRKTEVNIAEALKAGGLKTLPHAALGDASVWQDLQDDNDAANAALPKRTAFTSVELTRKGLLPLWMPPDTVGGKAIADDLQALDGEAPTGNLAEMTEALRKATSTPRFFRNHTQWVAAFLRYAIIAISMGQMTWVTAFNHIQVVCQIIERFRPEMKGRAQFLGILYSDMLLKSWAERALRRDPEMLFEKVSAEIDKQILEAAQSRLGAVMKASGITEYTGEKADGARNDVTAASSAIARQAAAAEALSKKAEGQAKQLQGQQDRLLRMQATPEKKGKGKGKKGDKGSRAKPDWTPDPKHKAWWDKRKHNGW